MGAEPKRHEDAPEKRGPSAIPQAYVSWMQALGCPENPALPKGPASVGVEHPGPAETAPPFADETLANLFRAIEGTEFARSLGAIAPPSVGPTLRPGLAEPPDIPEPLPATTVPRPAFEMPKRPPSAAPRKTAVAGPNPTLLVRSPSHAASAPPMPRPGAPRRLTAPAEPPATPLPAHAARIVPPPPPVPRKAAEADHRLTLLVQTAPSPKSTWLLPAAPKSAESLPARVAERSLPPEPIAAAELAPVFNSPRLSRSVEDGLATAPVFAPIHEELNPLAANAAQAVKSACRAGIQLSIGIKTWITTEAAPAALWLGRAAMHSTLRLTSFAAASTASATKRIARAGSQLTAGLKNWIATEAAPTMQRLGRAAIKLSLRFTSFAVTSAASAAKHIAHAGAQLSAALRSRSHAEPAAAAERMARARTQLSSGLQNWMGPRRSPRLQKPPVVAWCWAADTPQSLGIANISSSGLYLLTEARWPLGGTVPMTLQRTDRSKGAPESWIVIDFTVVRWCRDGVAGALLPPSPYSVASGSENCADQRTLKRFVKQLAEPAHR